MKPNANEPCPYVILFNSKQPTAWGRVFLVPQFVEKFPDFMELEGSLPRSQNFAIGPDTESV